MSNERRVYEIERDRFGILYSGPLEKGECLRVVPVAELESAERELQAHRRALCEIAGNCHSCIESLEDARNVARAIVGGSTLAALSSSPESVE